MPTRVPQQDHDIHLRLSSQFLADLRQAAALEGNPLSSLIRRLLVAGLARERKLAGEPLSESDAVSGAKG